MSKFNAGDKVRCISDGWTYITCGQIYTVSSTGGASVYVLTDTFETLSYRDDNFELATQTVSRKVIQLTSSSNSVHALCDDGTMWILDMRGWLPILNIPQGEVK